MEEAKVGTILRMLIIVKVYHLLWVSVTRRIQSTADLPKQDMGHPLMDFRITFFSLAQLLLSIWTWKQWLYFTGTNCANLERQAQQMHVPPFFIGHLSLHLKTHVWGSDICAFWQLKPTKEAILSYISKATCPVWMFECKSTLKYNDIH